VRNGIILPDLASYNNFQIMEVIFKPNGYGQTVFGLRQQYVQACEPGHEVEIAQSVIEGALNTYAQHVEVRNGHAVYADLTPGVKKPHKGMIKRIGVIEYMP
jgi:hypothetical protein